MECHVPASGGAGRPVRMPPDRRHSTSPSRARTGTPHRPAHGVKPAASKSISRASAGPQACTTYCAPPPPWNSRRARTRSPSRSTGAVSRRRAFRVRGPCRTDLSSELIRSLSKGGAASSRHVPVNYAQCGWRWPMAVSLRLSCDRRHFSQRPLRGHLVRRKGPCTPQLSEAAWNRDSRLGRKTRVRNLDGLVEPDDTATTRRRERR